jgi:hypothetical protein
MINFQAINSLNSVGILDAYHTGILEGYTPPGFIAPEVFRAVPSPVDTAQLIKSYLPLTLNDTIELGPTGFATIRLNFFRDKTFAMSYKGLQARLESYDIQQFGGNARAKAIWYKQLSIALDVYREYKIASALNDPTVITQYFTPTYTYDDYVNSDPIGDFAKARAIVVGGVGASYGSGVEANVAIMNWETFNSLCSNPKLIYAPYRTALQPNATEQTLDAKQLAAIMKVEKVLIGKSRYNSAEENQVPILTQLWGNHIVFAHVNLDITPDDAQQSLGYQFIPSTPDQGAPEVSYEWAQPGTLMQGMGSWLTRAKKYDDKLTDATCACLILNAVSSTFR